MSTYTGLSVQSQVPRACTLMRIKGSLWKSGLCRNPNTAITASGGVLDRSQCGRVHIPDKGWSRGSGLGISLINTFPTTLGEPQGEDKKTMQAQNHTHTSLWLCEDFHRRNVLSSPWPSRLTHRSWTWAEPFPDPDLNSILIPTWKSTS